MENIMQEIMPAVVSIVVVLLGAVGTYVAKKANLVLDTKLKKDIVKMAVEYVEQTAKLLGSEEKLALAKEQVVVLLARTGLKITDAELNTMIEAVVLGFKKEYQEEIMVIDGREVMK